MQMAGGWNAMLGRSLNCTILHLNSLYYWNNRLLLGPHDTSSNLITRSAANDQGFQLAPHILSLNFKIILYNQQTNTYLDSLRIQ